MPNAPQDYAGMLAATEPAQLGSPAPQSDAHQAGLERFTTFFADMTPQRVRDTIEQVYAPDAILHDTVVTHRGIREIAPYLQKTAERANGVKVTVDQVIIDGAETFIRWTMDIKWRKINDGRTTRSVGISHLRFAADGRVALQHDFWDSATGLYQHLPILGPLLRWVRGKFGQV